MVGFVVLEPPRDRHSEPVFLRDGFVWLGFLFPVFWLLFHRLWIEAAVALAATLGLAALGAALDQPAAGSALSLAVSLFVGLEGQAMRMAALRRRGWIEWGAVDAADAVEAEIRYIALGGAGLGLTSGRPVAAPAPANAMAAAHAGPALGLLAYPGHH